MKSKFTRKEKFNSKRGIWIKEERFKRRDELNKFCKPFLKKQLTQDFSSCFMPLYTVPLLLCLNSGTIWARICATFDE